MGSGFEPDPTTPFFLRTLGFVLDDGVFTTIELPNHDSVVAPAGVNSAGTVVGQMANSDLTGSSNRAFVWTEEAGLAVLPVADEATEDARATAVDEAGRIVGESYPRGRSGEGRAWIWAPHTGVTTLAAPSGMASAQAADINDLGQVVGAARAAGGAAVPVLWAPPSYTPTVLPVPAAGGSAVAIDGDGTIVGAATDGSASYVWSPAADHPRTTVPGLRATDIDGGDIVGWVDTADGRRAALLEAGETQPEDLGTLDGAASEADAIAGDVIVGQANGRAVSFIRKPD